MQKLSLHGCLANSEMRSLSSLELVSSHVPWWLRPEDASLWTTNSTSMKIESLSSSSSSSSDRIPILPFPSSQCKNQDDCQLCLNVALRCQDGNNQLGTGQKSFGLTETGFQKFWNTDIIILFFIFFWRGGGVNFQY